MEQRFTAEKKDIESWRTILRTYENKEELKNEINKSFAKYISEFNIIPESLKDKRVEEVDRTPAENLAYQVGWTTLVIKWESDERKGIPVKTSYQHLTIWCFVICQILLVFLKYHMGIRQSAFHDLKTVRP